MSIDVSKYRVATASAKSEATPWWNRDISLGTGKLNNKKKERLYSELHALLMAGVDVRSALELLEQEQTKKGDRELLQGIKEAVVKGAGLSLAMEQSGKFSSYEYYSIKIGEESGRLLEVLEQMAAYYGKRIKLQRQFVSVLAYPSFILLITVGVVYFMLHYIVPMFNDVFKRFDGELPELTQLVINLSENFSAWSNYVLIGITGLIVLVFTQRKQPWFRKTTAAFITRIPVFGKAVRKVYLARFCQAMHLLCASKTPLVEAIGLVEKMIGFYPMEQALNKVQEQLMRGVALHHGLAGFKVFEKRMVALIKVAEEVNQLDTMFKRLSDQYSEEVEHQTSIIGSVMEPLMIIIIAAFVGLILVAMYLPLFQLSTSIG